jgi:hypothetical protein
MSKLLDLKTTIPRHCTSQDKRRIDDRLWRGITQIDRQPSLETLQQLEFVMMLAREALKTY